MGKGRKTGDYVEDVRLVQELPEVWLWPGRGTIISRGLAVLGYSCVMCKGL